MNIKILATCRHEELLPATTMVFDSLRVGYPNASVQVYLNRLSGNARDVVLKCCEKVSANTSDVDTIHHDWITKLVESEHEPFIILDTDIVFWKTCEDWKFVTEIAGRYIPEFFDDFSRCITRARLHGSHLWVNPVRLRESISKWRGMFPNTPFTPGAQLISPIIVPVNGKNYFYDTGSLLYHAIGGERFTEAQNDCFDHLHCGTISDITGPLMPQIRQREWHFAVFEDQNLLKGAWREQEKYYLKNRA